MIGGTLYYTTYHYSKTGHASLWMSESLWKPPSCENFLFTQNSAWFSVQIKTYLHTCLISSPYSFILSLQQKTARDQTCISLKWLTLQGGRKNSNYDPVISKAESSKLWSLCDLYAKCSYPSHNLNHPYLFCTTGIILFKY